MESAKKTKLDVKHVMKYHAAQNIPLTFDEAYALGEITMSGCKGESQDQVQSIAILCALHNKAVYSWELNQKDADNHPGELPKSAAEQIAGICAAIFQHDIGSSEYGFLNPRVPYVMDNCGMGGDLTVTANVSTLAALIASAGGYYLCKHGSPANADEGRHGSSDFIALCGINEYADKDEVELAVERHGFGYTEALDQRYKRIHTQTHLVARLPHMNDIIGPITNPVNPKLMSRRVIGINHLVDPYVVVEAYRIMNERGITNMERLIAVRGLGDSSGSGGVDELSICESGSVVTELSGMEVRKFSLGASDFGLDPISLASISPPQRMSKGDFSLSILKGEATGDAVKMIIANAALLFYLGDYSISFAECYLRAQEVYESGEPYQVMLAVKDLLPRE